MKDRIYNLNLEQQEYYLNLKYQLGIEEAHKYLKEILSWCRTISSLVPLLYSLAIGSMVMKYTQNSLKKIKNKKCQTE
jgi:hypothetical protein